MKICCKMLTNAKKQIIENVCKISRWIKIKFWEKAIFFFGINKKIQHKNNHRIRHKNKISNIN